MSGVTFQRLLASGGPVIKSTLVANVHATPAGTTNTFTAANFGAAFSGRVLLAIVETNDTAVSSVTIGGVTATALTASAVGRIYAAAVPTGTSGDVVVNTSATMTRCAVQLYSLSGYTTLVASASATSTANPVTATLTVPAGGAAFAGAIQTGGNSTAISWSGVTTDANATDALTNYGSGSINSPGGGSLAMTGTFNGTVTSPFGVFCTLAPS